jgi:hypothetical protein
MKKASSSPQRHTFQKQSYLEKLEKADDPDRIEDLEAMIDMFDQFKSEDQRKTQDPEWQKNNMEYDLRTCDWILEKVRGSDSYAQNLYASMCNNDFQKLDVVPILKDQTWSASWRHAGGIIADMRQQGDYIDWYCSGIGGFNREYQGEETNEQWQKRTGYVPEGLVTGEIRDDLQRLGWVLVPGGDWEDFNNKGEKVK